MLKLIDIIKHSVFYYRLRHSIRDYYVFYADSTEMLDKAQKVLRPLPQGCELVHLSKENKDLYKSKWKVSKMLSVEGEVWAVVDNNEIIAYHYGTYKNKESVFFNVKNCDFEHIELMVDERYRRKGIGLHLLYHTVNNLNVKNIKNLKLGTVIRPNNVPSVKLHELIGFKRSHRVTFFHWPRVKDGKYVYLNFPHYSI